MVLNLIRPGEADKVLLAIKDRLQEFEARIQIQKQEVEQLRKSYNDQLKRLEQLKLESDQIKRIALPKFSIVTYTPKTPEYYRASYRHYDMIQQKSIPRVVHLGLTSNFKGKDDPELIHFAQVQIITYLMTKFPGIYADIISIK